MIRRYSVFGMLLTHPSQIHCAWDIVIISVRIRASRQRFDECGNQIVRTRNCAARGKKIFHTIFISYPLTSTDSAGFRIF